MYNTANLFLLIWLVTKYTDNHKCFFGERWPLATLVLVCSNIRENRYFEERCQSQWTHLGILGYLKQSEPLRENTGQDDYNVHRSLYRMPLGALVRAARPFQAESGHICLPHTM